MEAALPYRHADMPGAQAFHYGYHPGEAVLFANLHQPMDVIGHDHIAQCVVAPAFKLVNGARGDRRVEEVTKHWPPVADDGGDEVRAAGL